MLGLALGLSLVFLGACSPHEKNHGNLVQDHLVDRLNSGKHTKQTVLKILGSPTTRAAFDNNVWYYIGQKTETYGIFEPEIVDQKIILVAFDDDGFMTTAREIDAQTLNKLTLVEGETPTTGTEVNVLDQFLGNLGRFNQPLGASTSGDDNIGGPGLPPER